MGVVAEATRVGWRVASIANRAARRREGWGKTWLLQFQAPNSATVDTETLSTASINVAGILLPSCSSRPGVHYDGPRQWEPVEHAAL